MTVGDVFTAGAEGFARWTPLLWEPVGRATVDAARIAPGDHVLDVCCGTGGSALPAAEATGDDGHVDGVDLSDGLLAVARGRAAEAGLSNAVFHRYDATRWTGGPYDVTICVFGVFFLPDMDAGAAHLLAQTRPGGRFVVTTWENGSNTPLMMPVRDAVEEETGVRPEGTMSHTAGARIGSPGALAAWMTGIGVADVEETRFELDVPVTPDLAWDLVVGSGARMMLDGLDDAALARVHASYADRVRDVDVFHVRALIGAGTRPV